MQGAKVHIFQENKIYNRVNESYCVCVVLDYGQTVWVSPGLAYSFCFTLTTDAMLPHNDGFLLATAAFT